MNYVSLNHVILTRKFNILATLLLITGILVASAIFFHSQKLSTETARLQIAKQQLEVTNKPRLIGAFQQVGAKSDALKNNELTAVKEAIKEIVLPWPALFKSLESLNSTDVRLLALEPNAKQGKLQITAVALDSESMMRYLQELSQQRVLKEVVLQSQEINRDEWSKCH